MPAKQIQKYIDRYHLLRTHQDTGFSKNQATFTRWKTQATLQRYQPLMKDRGTGGVINYLMRDVFPGIDLSELSNAEPLINIIGRLLPNMDMLKSAVAFNTLTGEINQTVTETLFEKMGVVCIDEATYAAACHQANLFPVMEEQLNLFESFSSHLNAALANKHIGRGVKLARIPAKIAGFQNTHALIADGIQVASGVNNPQQVIATIIQHERATLNRLAANEQPFFISVAS